MTIVAIHGDNSPAGIRRHFERKRKEECVREIQRSWETIAKLRAENERLRTATDKTLDAIQDALQDAYNNAGLVCCGRGGEECCGCPEPEWDATDQAIMDTLGPIEKQLRESIVPQPQGGKSETA